MCTLVARFEPGATVPLVVAANRDERLDRRASGPRLWEGEAFVAPRDDVGGGTWLGLAKSGLFVGVTNRFGAPRDERRQSRGALVIDALRRASARSVHDFVGRVPHDRYNPFHLFYADRIEAFVTWCDGERVHQRKLDPGLHVVTERSLGGDDRARTERIREAWAQPPTSESLARLLSLHAADALGGTCVHLPELGYGTRSSAQLWLASPLESSRLLWAEGPPCNVAYEDRGDLLRALGV
jgi:hypothetical protein